MFDFEQAIDEKVSEVVDRRIDEVLQRVAVAFMPAQKRAAPKRAAPAPKRADPAPLATTGAVSVGQTVRYRQGRGEFDAKVVSIDDAGVAKVERLGDGKLVEREAAKLTAMA